MSNKTKMVKGFKVKLECVGYGKTEDEALDNLLFDMCECPRNIEHKDGADSLKFVECEIEDDA